MHIFPLMNFDPKNPDNCYSATADCLQKRTREDMGVDIFCRSRHGCACEPMRYKREAEEGRKLCDLFGFTKCALLDE